VDNCYLAVVVDMAETGMAVVDMQGIVEEWYLVFVVGIRAVMAEHF
jgi:hypothetical protein